MKSNYNRDWLQNYRTNPKTDTAIYKNYQNPSMTQWETQMGSLSPAQKGRYEQFTNTIPDEVKGLSAVEMQRYMQNLNEKQQGLAKEREGYDTQIQKVQEQARIRAQQEAQRQAQLRAQQEAQRQAQLRVNIPSLDKLKANEGRMSDDYNRLSRFYMDEYKAGRYTNTSANLAAMGAAQAKYYRIRDAIQKKDPMYYYNAYKDL